jgi:Trk K+ transport system NAD-binding subunit
MPDKPIVLCGLGRMGWRVLEYLRAAELPVVVVDNSCKADDPRLRGVRVVVGDIRHRDILEAAGVRDARGVIVITSDDLVNISAMLQVRALNADVRVVLRMFNQNLIARLEKAIKNVFALSTSLLTAPVLAVTAMTGQGLGTFRLEGQPDGTRQVAEVTVRPGSSLKGRTIVEVTGYRDLLVLAYLPDTGPPQLLLDVNHEARLAAGDRLVVSGKPQAVNALLNNDQPPAPHKRWGNWFRRNARVVLRTLAEVDRAVLICTVLVVGVIATSTTLLMIYEGKHFTTIDRAFFAVIMLIATAAGVRDVDFDTAEMRVFAGLLRIFGAILTAAFTAIVTNFLLRARLRGALEVARIPDRDHFVICGLSPVGYRVAEELLHYGEAVVVIEKDANNRFVATLRRRKVAVVIGDATVTETLRQAHAATAGAVIVATNHDLVNLESALLVRELNPRQRVVLLQSEPLLADMLRQAANVQLAVSVPALAAPAFLAGLYGDRVQNVFLVCNRLLALIDLVIQPADALRGQSVRTVAVDYRLVPVTVLPGAGRPAPKPLQARLTEGDRLVAVVELHDLDRLLRRQPAAAAFAVDVSGFPLPTRGWLVNLVRTVRGVGAEEAEKAVGSLPLRLQSNLTRGQAEDLLATLTRERVTARISRPDAEQAAKA